MSTNPTPIGYAHYNVHQIGKVTVSFLIRNGCFEMWSSLLTTDKKANSYIVPLYENDYLTDDLMLTELHHCNRVYSADSGISTDIAKSRGIDIDVNFLDVRVFNYTIRVRGAGFFFIYVIELPEQHEEKAHAELANNDVHTYGFSMPVIVKQKQNKALLFNHSYRLRFCDELTLHMGWCYITFLAWSSTPTINLNIWGADKGAPGWCDSVELPKSFKNKPIRVITEHDRFVIKDTGLLFWKTLAVINIVEKEGRLKLVPKFLK